MSGPSTGASAVEDRLAGLCGMAGTDGFESFADHHPELLSAETVEDLGERVRQCVRVDVDMALRLSEAAISIAVRLGDHASLGRGFRAKANSLWFQGNCKAAVDYFDRAVGEFESADVPAEVGRTLSSSIQTLVLLGDYERAYSSAEKARQIFTELNDNWRLARLELNVANILHRQDRFAEALTGYERAYETLAPCQDKEGTSVALHNLAVCLIMLDDFDRALACYQRVHALCVSNDMPLLALQADYNIAYLYFLRGDYNTALAGLRRTQEKCRAGGDAYHAALCALDQAEIYLELNLTDEALRVAQEAKTQFESQQMAFEMGRSIANLAIATHRQSDNAAALKLFEEAKRIFAKEDNAAWQALIDLYQSFVLFELGKHQQASSLCSRAREFFQQAHLDRREIMCDLLLARLSLEAGDTAKARELCEVVLGKVPSMDAPLLNFRAHLLLGHAERHSGDLERARISYNDARQALETLRSSIQTDELKISFLKDKADVYESLVGVCLDRQPQVSAETVFQHIQQAKSRSLADMVLGRSGSGGWNVSRKATESVTALRRELNWYYHRLDIEQASKEDVSADRVARLRLETRRKEEELVRALRDLEAGEPAQELRAAAPVDAAGIRSALHRDAAIVEYFQTGADFIAAVMDSAGTNVVRLASVESITASVRSLQFQLSRFRFNGTYPASIEARFLEAVNHHLAELFTGLIAPLVPFLRKSHLVIAPHGILHYIPFHALFDGKDYLIDRYTVSYAPSASIYAMCQHKEVNREGPSLLMGIQDQSAPWIEQEIATVSSVVSSPAIFLGDMATSEILRSLGPTSRIIHIATHGFFRRDNPLFSSVRLADMYLSLHDFYDLHLPVELLTLSGCGTGLPVVAAGDELLGLARGLLCAGAQTLMLALWDVHDHTTAEFMLSFYTHFRQEDEKRTALRSAMLETRARRPHPYFWAPFVLVGKAFDSLN